ncbi:MAG TPA: DUF1844 domain-containing protein [Acidobacteriota bacterium]|nr:DUF1844 domain-containing protein [Acidobacteriota bacterium]
MADREQRDEGFKIFDRRKFTITGEERTDLPPEEQAPPTPPRKELPKQEKSKRPASSREPSPADLGGEFSAFLMSLANTAMVYMEASKDPKAGHSNQNLAASKQMIDWLGVLQRKTEGNRTAEESLLLENLLYELRMQYLSKSKIPQV